MNRKIILTLALVLTIAAFSAVADETTTTNTSTTTLGDSTTTTTTLMTTTGTGETPTPPAPAAVAPGTSIRSGAKNLILDNINLIIDTVSNYKRDRFLLSRNYSTYLKLIKENKGKDNTSSKSVWADIADLEKKTLPEEELQMDKLVKELRNYVQDLN